MHARNRTPYLALLFSYVIIATMALLPIEAVATAADIMFLVLFILVNAVLVVLRYRRPDIRRPFKVPFVPYLPLVTVVLQIAIGYYLITELTHGLLMFAVTSAGWLLELQYTSLIRGKRGLESLKKLQKQYYVEKARDFLRS